MLNQKIIDEIIKRIVAVAHPQKIILFGSHARDNAGESSDVDLLVVKAGAQRRKLAQAIYQNLVGVEISVDVVVATPEDLEKYKDSSLFVYSSALKEGQEIYAA